MALNGSDSEDRIVGSKLDLISQAILFGVEASKENFWEVSLAAFVAMPSKPILSEGTVLANGCLAIVPQ